MKAGMIFTGTGPILILTTFESFKDPNLISMLTAKGIEKYIAAELPLNKVKAKYGNQFKVVMGDLKQSDDLRVLDYNGYNVFHNFPFSEMGEPIFIEPRERKYYRLFREVSRVINSTLDLEEVLKLITENTVRVLKVKGCVIRLLDPKRNTLDVTASHGLSETYLKKGPVDADKSMVDTLKGETVLIFDTSKDLRLQYPEEAKREGIASILSVPVSVKGKVIGVLRIYTSRRREFSENEMEFASALAEMSGIAIDNARMYSHLKGEHEKLIRDVQQWFEFSKTV
jgi:hypothetical protein